MTKSLPKSAAVYHEVVVAVRALCREGPTHFRAAVAWAALNELPPEDAAKISALFMPTGSPLPVLSNTDDDAQWWADRATHYELGVHALAAVNQRGGNGMRRRARLRLLVELFNSLSDQDRRKFLERAGGGTRHGR